MRRARNVVTVRWLKEEVEGGERKNRGMCVDNWDKGMRGSRRRGRKGWFYRKGVRGEANKCIGGSLKC